MIVNHRTYTITPRKMKPYLELVEHLALPVMKKHGFELVGYYVAKHGHLNQVVHIWKYDNMADMEQKRMSRDADPAWADYLSKTEGMVQSQVDQILTPAPFSPDAG